MTASARYSTDPDLVSCLTEKILIQAGISLEQIQTGISVLQKVSGILLSSNIPLPPLNLNVENLVQQSATLQSSTSSNDDAVKLIHFLKDLRLLSIALLKSNKLNKSNVDLGRTPANQTPPEPEVKDNAQESDEDVPGHNLKQLNNICYICKESSPPPKHSFYPWLCLKCGDLNFQKRYQTANLGGKVALVTGGRTKIGYEIVLKLLRCDVKVIVTTRFPVDALKRYEKEKDFSTWKDKLRLYRLDLRFLRDVENFCDHINKSYDRLDILIENAAQTVRRPTVYYRELVDGENNTGILENGDILQRFTSGRVEEKKLLGGDENGISDTLTTTICVRDVQGQRHHEAVSMVKVHRDDYKYEKCERSSLQHFPSGILNKDGDPIDLRGENSWTLDLEDVESGEMVEVALVNYMAPYIILQRLTPLMKRGRSEGINWGWVVLVSAMEGKFEDCQKSAKHPHTNAAKAALNMLVRTSGKHYQRMGLLLTAVDTGWVTQEHPAYVPRTNKRYSEQTPLDVIDGAARVLDPIFHTANTGKVCFGKFLKDYFPTSW